MRHWPHFAAGTEIPYMTYLKHRYQLDQKGIQFVPYNGSVAPFMASEKFAQQGYSFSEPLHIRELGGECDVLLVSSTGYNPYCSCLVVGDDLLQSDPDLVVRFTRAARRGWEQYVRDPSRANAAIHELNGEQSLETLNAGAREIAKLVQPAPEAEIGTMLPARFKLLQQQMEESGSLQPGSVDAAAAFDTAILAAARQPTPSAPVSSSSSDVPSMGY